MIKLVVLRSNVTVFFVIFAAVAGGRFWEDVACPAFGAEGPVAGDEVLAMIDCGDNADSVVSDKD